MLPDPRLGLRYHILRENTRLLTLMVEQAAARYGVGEAAQQDILRATLERGAYASIRRH